MKKSGGSHGHGHSHGNTGGGGGGGAGGHHHSHGHGSHEVHADGKFCGCCHVSNTTRLGCMLVMTFAFFLVELITGHITKSISLTTDSFHMLSDSMALVIGLVSAILSRRKSTKNTFGWVRAEILGALVNSVFLVSLCLGIVVEAIERLIERKEINEPKLLFIVGFIGLTINVIGLFIFGHAHSHNLPPIPTDSDDDEDENSDDSETEESDEDMCCSRRKQNNCDSDHNNGHEADAMIVKSQNDGSDVGVGVIQNGMADPQIEVYSVGERGANANSTKTTNAEATIAIAKNSSSKKNSHHGHSHNSHGHSHSSKNKKTTSANSKAKSSKTRCHILSDEANMNMRAVFLHVLADALGSVIVIISALLNIYRGQLHIPDQIIVLIDPLLCLALVILILISTIPLLKESALILLQTVPKEIKINKLKQDIVQKINGIISVHELHVWKLSGNKIIATAHVTCHNSVEYMQIATELKEFFHKKGIHSTTIQPEFTDIIHPNDGAVNNNCILECKKNTCNQNTCCGNETQKASSSPKANATQTAAAAAATTTAAAASNSKPTSLPSSTTGTTTNTNTNATQNVLIQMTTTKKNEE